MRPIPSDLNDIILSRLIGSAPTEENYILAIDRFELYCEKYLIEIFQKLGIKSLVKSSRKSLRYNNELLVVLEGETDMNAPYEFFRVANKILKEILVKDIKKFRFYIQIDVYSRNKIYIADCGKIEYRFRYHYSESHQELYRDKELEPIETRSEKLKVSFDNFRKERALIINEKYKI
ncbi:MAG: hypothetical protein WAT92_12285 [Saprospiraceae bacterium]